MASLMCLSDKIRTMNALYSHSHDIRMSLVNLNKETKSAFNHLKPHQLQAIEKSRTSDVFVCLKTGYGKSLVFQILPYLFSSCVLIICPLDVIVHQFLVQFASAVHFDEQLREKIATSNTRELSNVINFNKLKYVIYQH